jgi:LacI family transcriptional regulator, gluconate utilization system Gnt-I transcriptional repressor
VDAELYAPSFPAGVTLDEVASLAGVGKSTASRVLRDNGSFSAETRERVLQAATRLGYVPNRIAHSLSVGSRLVAIIVPSLNNNVFADVLAGAGDAVEEQGYQPVFAVTDYSPQREEKAIASLIEWRPAAILVSGLEHTDRSSRMLRNSGRRIVEMFDTDGSGLDCVVGVSNVEAGRAAARHLISRNYRRFGYVGHDFGRDIRAGKRLAGFEAGLQEGGVTLAGRDLGSAASSVEAGRAGLARLLDRAPDIDAVYFSNDDMAIGGYFHCLARGLAVPDRLALFGHNGLDLGSALPQPLATIRTPRVAIGREAARAALSGPPAQRIDLGFELVAGATA